MEPKVGDWIRVTAGRLKGHGGTVVAVNRALYEDRISCIAFSDDETDRVRWIDGKRLSDIRIGGGQVMGDVIGTVKGALGIGRATIEVEMVDGRRLRLTLSGDWEHRDQMRITRVINDGVRWQSSHPEAK